jgi:hypothetical protein
MTQKHALLSPSAAYRWMACPASIQECQEVPYKMPRDTSAAELGSKVHAAVEKKFSGKDAEDVEVIESAADDFVEYVKSFDFDTVYSEKTLYIKEQPDCWGTADIVGVKGDTLYIIDLKYGMYPVSALWNPQLMIYACAALDTLDGLEHVKAVTMIIYQPRLKNIDEFTLSRKSLENWKTTKLLPSAQIALGNYGEYALGTHCRYCPAKSACVARNGEIFERVVEACGQYREVTEDTKLQMIDNIMKRHDELSKFLKEVKEYAHYAMTQGHEFESVKLADGNKTRFITDVDGLIEKLKELGIDESDYKDMKSVASLEKIVGKDVLQFFVGERAGAPVVKRRIK